MKKVEFVELRRERPNYKDTAAKTHFFINSTEADVAKVTKDTLYMVVADTYGMPYIFDVTKLVKKHTSGKTWTPKMLSDISISLGRKALYLDDEGIVCGFDNDNDTVICLDKVMKRVAAEGGY